MAKFLSLTRIQSKILSCVELEPDLPAHEVAKRIKSKPSTVAYNLTQLKARGIIRRTLVINPLVLGLSYVALFFSARFKNSDRRHELVRKLSANNKVTWLGSLAGEFHFGLTTLIGELHELQDLLEPILLSSQAEITEKLVAPRLSFSFLSRAWGNSTKRTRQIISVAPAANSKHEEIDPIDQKLLATLGADAEQSGRQIAAKLGIPVSTVERRFEALRKRGIIAGFRFSIDGEKLGLSTYRILLSLSGMSASARKALIAFASNNQHVAMYVESFGAWDFEILIEVASPLELRDFLEQLMDNVGVTFERVTVLSELEDLKFSAWPKDLP